MASWCQQDRRRGRKVGCPAYSQYLSSCSSDRAVTCLLSSTSLGNGQRDTKDGVGAQLGLVGGAIKLDEEVIDGLLVLDIDVLLDELGANDGVDVLNSLQDTLSAPLGLVSITELACLVLACVVGLSVAIHNQVGRSGEMRGGTYQWKLPMGQWHGGDRSQ
jgi:hypothetical protein